MEQLGSLPMPALITFGAVLAVIFGVRYFGLWQGQQHAPAASAAAAGSMFVFHGKHKAVLINYPDQSELEWL